MAVVLPAPFGPRKPKTSPALTSRSSPARRLSATAGIRGPSEFDPQFFRFQMTLMICWNVLTSALCPVLIQRSFPSQPCHAANKEGPKHCLGPLQETDHGLLQLVRQLNNVLNEQTTSGTLPDAGRGIGCRPPGKVGTELLLEFSLM
jgi:hypothetical protein